MKKIVIGALSLVLVTGLGVGSYFTYKHFTDKPLKGSVEDSRIITMQLKGNEFLDIRIPGNAKLVSSNFDNTFEFDIITVQKLDQEPRLADLKKQFDGYWVTADSKDGWLVPTMDSFDKSEPYISYVDWDSKIFLEGRPELPTLPNKVHITKNGTYLPSEQIRLTALGDNTTLWYPEDKGFLYSNIVYGEYRDVINEYAAKMPNLYKSDFKEYYHDNGVFFARHGDFAVGVRYINRNTQYAISVKGEEAYPYFMQSLFNGGENEE